MKLFSIVLLLFCFLVYINCNIDEPFSIWSHVESELIVKEKNWFKTFEKVNVEENLSFIIALKLRNEELIPLHLMKVSDPKSSEYGKHYSEDKLEELFSPLEEDFNVVYDWVNEYNPIEIKSTSLNTFIKVTMKVKDVQKMFINSDFRVFKHENGRRVIRNINLVKIPTEIESRIDTFFNIFELPYIKPDSYFSEEYKLQKFKEYLIQNDMEDPGFTFYATAGDSAINVVVFGDDVRGNIDQVEISLSQLNGATINVTKDFTEEQASALFNSLANFVNTTIQVRAHNRTSNTWGDYYNYLSEIQPNPWFTPESMKKLYYIPMNEYGTATNNSQAVVEFDFQFYSPDDLSQFTQLMGLPDLNVTVYGKNNPHIPGGESTLDIEWISFSNIDTTFWYSDGFLTDWIVEITNTTNPPLVNSISYGSPEFLNLPKTTTRLNNEFAMLGLRGVSIISTSGDIGSSDGTRVCKKDVPDFPSSSPYTTSLGATNFARNSNTPLCVQPGHYSVNDIPIYCDGQSEVPCSAETGAGFTTGGGFSNRFPIPEYQLSFVQDYLNNAPLPPSGFFNASGRGFNDVAAAGSNILIIQNGKLGDTGGTSASGPIFAAIAGLLNDVRLNNGKSPLGFLNPFLYQTAAEYPDAYNTVSGGNNRCKELSSNGLAVCCDDGFSAVPNYWNPLVGLGTPNYSVLKTAVQNLV
eukprot:TRINITY_DN9376_c0_g1_i1.p1 TRINITY_DN9376_c0_g1~~TRINITY_DN9376_c0_g1_i1.p1  ORF type:complete len:708 (-),score=237.66 TRINITY_DN9376_c0_g1_i1:86-2164(-)